MIAAVISILLNGFGVYHYWGGSLHAVPILQRLQSAEDDPSYHWRLRSFRDSAGIVNMSATITNRSGESLSFVCSIKNLRSLKIVVSSPHLSPYDRETLFDVDLTWDNMSAPTLRRNWVYLGREATLNWRDDFYDALRLIKSNSTVKAVMFGSNGRRVEAEFFSVDGDVVINDLFEKCYAR